jgi:hypothetical protein
MRLTEDNFTKDAFAAGEEDLPPTYPLSFPHILQEQEADESLMDLLTSKPDRHKRKPFKHGDKSYDLITRDDKIVLPKSLQKKATTWYHFHLLHPGKTRMELTLGQHYCWTGMRTTIKQVCHRCRV